MRVTPPLVGDWIIQYLRTLAQTELEMDVDLDDREPDDLQVPVGKPLIIVRDDSGPGTELGLYDRTIGVSILAGSRSKNQPAKDIAIWVAEVLFDPDIVLETGSPIASVELPGCNGPYPVFDELDVSRFYLTAAYRAAGTTSTN